MDADYGSLNVSLFGYTIFISPWAILTRHDGKGKKDRTVPIPEKLKSELQEQLAFVADVHDADLRAGYDGVIVCCFG